MSLLMDALRKAEEAKRQAAQKQQDDRQQETKTNVSMRSVVEDMPVLEKPQEFDREPAVSTTMPAEPAHATEAPADVEAPFVFEIDENFGLDEKISTPDTVQEERSKAEAAPDSKANDLQQSSVAAVAATEGVKKASGTKEIDYIQPDELSRFAPSVKPQEHVLEQPLAPQTLSSDPEDTEPNLESAQAHTPNSGNFGLTLEEREPNVERPSIIDDGLNVQAEPVEDQKSDSTPETMDEIASAPIRALRSDDAVSSALEKSQTASPASSPTKAAAPKFAEESRKRESARAVFSAKQKSKDKGGRKKLIAAAAVIALFPLAGGGYLLLESMDVFSSGNQYNIPPNYDANAGVYDGPLEDGLVQESVLPDLSPESIATDEQFREVAIAESDISEPSIPEPSIAEVKAEIVPEPMPTIARESPPAVEQAPIVPEVSIAAQESEVPNEVVLDSALEDAVIAAVVEPEAQAFVPISITRTDNAARVDPQLTQAYASYRSNDFIGARARYQQVLRDKPNNRDAMLGLAAVAMQLGDTPSARVSYIKLLELDPRDVHARVGLLETMPASDPVMLESELRALFAAHPEVAQLPFALGNHFASQRRWSDAQQSYYDALLAAKAGGGGPISPDYAFNLAVSLERLNQLSPAYTFYREALEQSQLVTPGFDIRVLRERLDAIERVLP